MKREGRTSTIFTAVLGIAAGACGSTSIAAGDTAANDEAVPAEAAPVDEATVLRAEGPAGLAKALARYDAAPEGAIKEALAVLVDRVAAQRYATVSRLFWHTDIAAARKAAADAGKPILSLRMLGRLDEDLSCANSRLFRTVLYANEEVSSFLADEFILHWSSERVVPKVTVDYGDGRVIETTIAGNSAHYVLDHKGRPVDVVPGLYGPKAFMTALGGTLSLVAETTPLDGAKRVAALTKYHRKAMASVQKKYSAAGVATGQLFYRPGGSAIAAAERRTISKMAIEMPVLRSVKFGKPLMALSSQEDLASQVAGHVKEKAVLDTRSRELIASLRPGDWAAAPKPLNDAKLKQLLKALETRIDGDTVISELGIRYQIHGWFAGAQKSMTFAALNKRIYSQLFLTPASDPWLGIATPGVFTGLPGDGVRQAQTLAISN